LNFFFGKSDFKLLAAKFLDIKF